MQSSYKEYARKLIKARLKQSRLKSINGVSIITCTNKLHALSNILDNYNRQDYKEKELILIINNDEIDLEQWLNKTKNYKNIDVYKLSEKTSLGHCLNFAVTKSKYNIIAKFDDDDYYGPLYISDTIQSFGDTDAMVIGKRSNFIYFVEKKILGIRTPGNENKFVEFANGSTLVFKKEVFNTVRFRNLSLAEDDYFCRDCVKNNIKIYSTNKYHHVYFRHPNKEDHTWKIKDDEFIRRSCQIIGPVEDYISYANNMNN